MNAARIIPAGVGFNVGADFYRAPFDMPLRVTDTRGGYLFGFVDPIESAPVAFMRPVRAGTKGIYVHVQARFTRETTGA